MARYNLGPLSQVPPGEGRTFDVDGSKIAVFNARNGCVYATQAECPHRGGPLSDGLSGGATLICPLHEWSFDLTTGRSMNGEACLRTFPIEQTEDGTLSVEIDGS
jgi:nitrite reductase (NADH) small subunit